MAATASPTSSDVNAADLKMVDGSLRNSGVFKLWPPVNAYTPNASTMSRVGMDTASAMPMNRGKAFR